MSELGYTLPTTLTNESDMASTVAAVAHNPVPMMVQQQQVKRLNRRKQDISAAILEDGGVGSDSGLHHVVAVQPQCLGTADASSGQGVMKLGNERWLVTDEFGYGGEEAFGDDLEDDDLHFKGYSYTCNSPGDEKSLLDFFACQKCPAIFDSRVGLTNHSKLHGGNHPLACGICDFGCTNRKTLRYHRRAHGFMPRRGRVPKRELMDEEYGYSEGYSVLKVETLEEQVQDQIGATSKGKRGRPKRSNAMVMGDGGVNLLEPVGPSAQSQTQRKRVETHRTNKGDAHQLNDVQAGVDHDEEGEEKFIIIRPTNVNSELIAKLDPPPLLSRGAINLAGFEEEEEEEEDEECTMQQANTSSIQNSFDNRYSARRGGLTQTISRKIVKCPLCPYRTQTRARLRPHMQRHSKSYGFLCSLCGFKHESLTWLKHHCMLHRTEEGRKCQWPPIYVKRPDEQGRGIAAAVVKTEAMDQSDD